MKAVRTSHFGAIAVIVSAVSVSAALGGCTAGLPFEGDISARPSPVLELSWAKAKRTVDGIVVSGQIQQVHCCRYVRGHIHFEAKDQSGAVLAATDAPWGEFNPRQLHSAWFRAELPVRRDQRVSTIDIQFSIESPN